MVSRFFFPEPLPQGDCFELPDALAHHAVRVLRLSAGERIVLFDGFGGEVEAVLEGQGKRWSARLVERRATERESPLQIVLVQALASADKMDWVVQKAVELGVSGVIPVRAARSVLKLTGERADKRVAHWREVAVSACEQSGRNRVPDVARIADLRDYLAQTRGGPQRLILDPVGGRRLADIGRPQAACHVLIGPEGGWSDDELAACRAAGCEGVTLGPRVLRTETAGLAALAALQALWGDF
ncbi:MAG: 16S rRNA (uracil(1498)-N(3))-methyltransferase [Zoogloeaceae bacterium]|nr:16S rRNA (uracil(1498)-N(3))-methyltransferase [Zoogloeaceae bacterium]